MLSHNLKSTDVWRWGWGWSVRSLFATTCLRPPRASRPQPAKEAKKLAEENQAEKKARDRKAALQYLKEAKLSMLRKRHRCWLEAGGDPDRHHDQADIKTMSAPICQISLPCHFLMESFRTAILQTSSSQTDILRVNNPGRCLCFRRRHYSHFSCTCLSALVGALLVRKPLR